MSSGDNTQPRDDALQPCMTRHQCGSTQLCSQGATSTRVNMIISIIPLFSACC